jgi:hypothetical protein
MGARGRGPARGQAVTLRASMSILAESTVPRLLGWLLIVVWPPCRRQSCVSGLQAGGQGPSPHRLHTPCNRMARRRPARGLARPTGKREMVLTMPRRRMPAGQIADGGHTNGIPADRELDPHYRRGNQCVHRSRCRPPARLACAPAAGGAGCAGRRAGLTHPKRRTSTATAVMSGGMAGLGACVTARSSRNANTPG